MRWTVHLEGGPRRVNHAAVAVGEKIFSFGGYCTGEDYKIQRPMDVHRLDTVSLRWVALPIRGNSQHNNEAPFQRYGHTAVAYGDLIYVWGGRNDISACKELFCFNSVTYEWSKPKTQGNVPGARDGHSSCMINRKMYIFGGYEEELNEFSQQVYALDLKSMSWNHVKAEGTPPCKRDFHSATAIGHYMYVFGGRSGRIANFYSNSDEEYCNKVMRFDTVNHTWNELKSIGPIKPDGRRSHSAFLFQDHLFVFGGYNGIINRHYADLYSFDPVTCKWSVVKARGKGPCPRRRQCCCVIGHKVYLFGGTSPDPNGSRSPASLQPGDTLDTLLMDHNDLHILDFSPSLKTLCEIKVIEYSLDGTYLPVDIRWELDAMTTQNSISRPLNNAG